MSVGINSQYDFFKKVNLDEDGNLGVSVIGGSGLDAGKKHGYFDIRTAFLDGGVATDTAIPLESIDTWLDVDLTVDATVDKRPQDMIDAQATAYDATTGIFQLEGMTTDSFGSLTSSFSFDPDEDEGELSIRVLLQAHTGVTPTETSIEDVIASMAQGADQDYVLQSSLEFAITEDINTNGVGDAGTVKFQIKSTVPGTVSMRSLTYYLHNV